MADSPADTLARHLYWQLKLDDRQQPIAWWAELGDYYVEIECAVAAARTTDEQIAEWEARIVVLYPGGSTPPRSWEVRHATNELVRCGTARSLAEAKSAAAQVIQEVNQIGHNITATQMNALLGGLVAERDRADKAQQRAGDEADWFEEARKHADALEERLRQVREILLVALTNEVAVKHTCKGRSCQHWACRVLRITREVG